MKRKICFLLAMALSCCLQAANLLEAATAHGAVNGIAEAAEEEVNQALGALAISNQPLWGGWDISRIVDGDRSTLVHGDVVIEPGFAYEIDLGVEVDLTQIDIFSRQDGCCPERLSNYRVSVHQDDEGKMGPEVWGVDLHTFFTDPGSFPGAKDSLTADWDPSGEFKGQWIRILSLDDPVPSYALQIAEVEVFGTPAPGLRILVTQQPQNAVAALGQTATFTTVVNVINGDPALIRYQWQKNSEDIEGATEPVFTTPPILSQDDGSIFRSVISYPGHDDIVTEEATLRINFARGAAAFSNRPLWSNWAASRLTDGNRSSTLHGNEDIEPGFAYEINLGIPVEMDQIDIYPRQDGCCPERLTNFRVSIHQDDDGTIGAQVWSVDLFTDFTNPGASSGTVVKLTADQDPSGEFEGEWIRILSLEDPVQNYALQINEVEVFGAPAFEGAVVAISREPEDVASAPGRTATFSVEARFFNLDPSLLQYQWQKNGTAISGATSASFSTPVLSSADEGALYRVVISYPGIADVISNEAQLLFDYNYARGSDAYSNRPLWTPGNWNPSMLVDGDRETVFHGDVDIEAGFAYQIDMGLNVRLEEIHIYPRQDGCCPERFTNVQISVHKDDNGQIGEAVWSADLFTDWSNPGSGPGIVLTLTAEEDPGGQFEGQWVRILSLEDPVQNYALQMTELEVIGRIDEDAVPSSLEIARSDAGLILTWTEGLLESASDVTGPWAEVGDATSPHAIQADQNRRFFRLKL